MTRKCINEVEVGFLGRDLWITRLALDDLVATSTRKEHVYRDIRAALAKPPDAHEPSSSDCECSAENADV